MTGLEPKTYGFRKEVYLRSSVMRIVLIRDSDPVHKSSVNNFEIAWSKKGRWGYQVSFWIKLPQSVHLPPKKNGRFGQSFVRDPAQVDLHSGDRIDHLSNTRTFSTSHL